MIFKVKLYPSCKLIHLKQIHEGQQQYSHTQLILPYVLIQNLCHQ